MQTSDHRKMLGLKSEKSDVVFISGVFKILFIVSVTL